LFSLSCEVEKFMIDTQSSSNNKRINQRVHWQKKFLIQLIAFPKREKVMTMKPSNKW
jgi:hypothetical protein